MSLSTQNQSILDCMRWLFTEKNCFRTAIPDNEIKSFFDETHRLLSHATDSISQSELESIINVASENFLLILTNCSIYFESHHRIINRSKKNENSKISFTTTEINYEKACKYLKDNIHTDEMYKHYKNFENTKFVKTVKSPVTHKFLKISLCILLVLLLIGFAIWLSGCFVSPTNDAPEFRNVFDRIGYWFQYDLLGNEKPLSPGAQWIKTTNKTGKITLLAFCIILLITIVIIFTRIIFIKHKRKIIQQWHSISLLFAKFADVSMKNINWEDTNE